MGKIVIVAEKPDVGTRLAATLGGCYINGTELKPDMLGSRKWEGIIKKERFTKGYLGCNYHGRELIVTWGFGHMAELKQAADYDPKYRRWSETLFPFIPPSYEIKLKEGAGLKKHFQLLKKFLTARDTEYIINATDADREGELIFDYIYRLSGSRKPFKRLWISSFTEEAVINGFKQLKDSEAVKALTEAGRCRAIADWLVGANFTALSTVKFGGFRNMISVGRVQTPTLALLVNRELEIQGFAPETYFELVATFLTAKGEAYLGKWQVGKTDRFKDPAAAAEVLARVEGKDGLVTKHETTTNKELPPLLYDLNTLQGDANSRFGLSAKKTLDIAQKLYENQLITYPRTNSRYLTTDLQPEISRVIKALPPEYEPWRETLLGKNLPISPRIFNNAKVESHHAIIPTYKTAKNLTPEEQKIYGLVARSLLKAFMPPAVWGNTKVVTEVAGELFYSSGRV
ncbi:MAG TPA: DNA topoisomerase, partial [Verrucomicrobiae bacterium]|nr:DNA topoisomerase [Verrucomicrobiae bacterium]